jgi:hypothetical protein
MQFVKRDDFVGEYHKPVTYTTAELADKPEGYFYGEDTWDGGTSGGDIAIKHGMDVYYFWRSLDDNTVEVLLEGYTPNFVAYCTLQTGLGLLASSTLIGYVIGLELLDSVLVDLKKAMGL